VASPGPGAIVTGLFIILLGLLGGLRVGSAGESGATGKIQANSRRRIENAACANRVHDLVGVAVVGEAKGVDIRSVRKVEAESIPESIVMTLERLVIRPAE
jgi:hypothetical protein